MMRKIGSYQPPHHVNSVNPVQHSIHEHTRNYTNEVCLFRAALVLFRGS